MTYCLSFFQSQQGALSGMRREVDVKVRIQYRSGDIATAFVHIDISLFSSLLAFSGGILFASSSKPTFCRFTLFLDQPRAELEDLRIRQDRRACAIYRLGSNKLV